jgi:MFS family permease
MAPIMAGLIVSSVLGGRLVSRTGRYKRFPVAGLAVGTLAYLAMAWAVSHGTPANTFDALLVVLGLGLGLVMPNITTAVQNAVDQRDVGVATATLGFFRSLGGALGVAISGTILNVTLHAATAAPGSRSLLALGLSELRALPAPARAHLTGAYVQALAITFSAAAGVSALAFAVVLAMPERALRGRSPSG